MLTDGYQTTAPDVTPPQNIANDLKRQGVTIFVVGIGPEVDRAFLNRLASPNLVITARDFEELLRSTQQVKDVVQGALRAPSAGSARVSPANCGKKGNVVSVSY